MSIDDLLPCLRPLDIKRAEHNGSAVFYLRDPLDLREGVVLVSVELGPLLLQFDGTRTSRQARAELLLRYGLPLPDETISHVARVLSDACLLADEM